MYFSGLDALLYVNDTDMELDSVSLEFSIINNSRPLYSPGNELVQAFMDSTVLVQGTLILNHIESYVNIIEDGDNLIIKYSKKGSELNVAGVYNMVEHEKRYIIEDIQIISYNQAFSPIADNLTDIYQFIGKKLD